MAIYVLPDLPRTEVFLHRLISNLGPVIRCHPSGNPWITGSLENTQVLHVANRDVEVIVIGHCHLSKNEAQNLLRDTKSTTELDFFMSHVIEFDVVAVARDAQTIRAQAPSLLAKSFFWTDTADGSVISNEQLPLACLSDLAIDDKVLISRLTDAELSYPFSIHSIWKNVHTLAPGQHIKVVRNQSPQAIAHWNPPLPTRRLAELVPELTHGLRSSIGARTAHAPTVSTDLSGGLDSTTLSFYTAELNKDHHTFFINSTHEENNDRVWAARAAREVGSAHITAQYQEAMSALESPEAISLALLPEGPSMTSASAAAAPWIQQKLEASGSTIHLNGHAGDALFGPVSTMLWSLVRSRTPGKLQRAMRHCALNRVPRRAAISMLARQGSITSDLRSLIGEKLTLPKYPESQYAHWVVTPNIHRAITENARSTFLDLVADMVDQKVEHLSADRTTHQILQFLSVHGTDVRRMNQAMGRNSSMYHDSPYLDIRVVEAALALNISERAYQYPAKPLLSAARPENMSIDYFLRRDKGEYSTETFDEHSSQRDRIRKLFLDGSELEDLGIISRPLLLSSLDEYSVDGQSFVNTSYLEIAERWLRSLRQIQSTALPVSEHMS